MGQNWLPISLVEKETGEKEADFFSNAVEATVGKLVAKLSGYS